MACTWPVGYKVKCSAKKRGEIKEQHTCCTRSLSVEVWLPEFSNDHKLLVLFNYPENHKKYGKRVLDTKRVTLHSVIFFRIIIRSHKYTFRAEIYVGLSVKRTLKLFNFSKNWNGEALLQQNSWEFVQWFYRCLMRTDGHTTDRLSCHNWRSAGMQTCLKWHWYFGNNFKRASIFPPKPGRPIYLFK